MSHTPAPWKIEEIKWYENEMLEVLKILLEAYEGHMHSEYDYPSDTWSAEGRNDFAALRAKKVIAKAEADARLIAELLAALKNALIIVQKEIGRWPISTYENNSEREWQIQVLNSTKEAIAKAEGK